MNPLFRLAITGQEVGLPIKDCVKLLDKETCLHNINIFVEVYARELKKILVDDLDKLINEIDICKMVVNQHG